MSSKTLACLLDHVTLSSARLDYSPSSITLFDRRWYSLVQTGAILVCINKCDLEKATVCFMPVLSFNPDRAPFLQSKMAKVRTGVRMILTMGWGNRKILAIQRALYQLTNFICT